MSVNIIFDVTSIIFRSYKGFSYNNRNGEITTEEKVGLAIQDFFYTLQRVNKKFAPSSIALAFEGGDNWRKKYNTIRGIQYKSNRSYTDDDNLAFSCIQEFYQVMKEHSSLFCIKVPQFEGDDVIAAYVKINESNSYRTYIISYDEDFIQLDNETNSVIHPKNLIKINVPEYKNYAEDVKYFLFEKCIRGDTGDGVLSAYPRVRKTKLLEAYKDEFQYINLMNTEVSHYHAQDNSFKNRKVEELYAENKILIDLMAIPQELKDVLYSSVFNELQSHSKYYKFGITKFLKKYKVLSLASEIDNYTKILQCNQLSKHISYTKY